MGKVKKIEDIRTRPVRYFRLVSGLFLYALGVVISINADLGYAPWDVFHQGISNITGLKIGTANVLVGLTILAIGAFKGQRPGIGTISNMLLIGNFVNLIMWADVLPIFSNLYIRILTLPISLLIMSLGVYLYISSAFGAGPRDGVMIMLHERTGRSITFVRNAIEMTALLVGYLLGGPVGIGTVILSVGTGYALEFVFDIFDFKTSDVEHSDWYDIVDSVKEIFGK